MQVKVYSLFSLIAMSCQLSTNLNLSQLKRLENTTRWGSSYLSLESLKKAYDRGAFTDTVLPVPIEIVEMYLQILKTPYLTNIEFQGIF
jgi:hypothetical protein